MVSANRASGGHPPEARQIFFFKGDPDFFLSRARGVSGVVEFFWYFALFIYFIIPFYPTGVVVALQRVTQKNGIKINGSPLPPQRRGGGDVVFAL